MAAQGFRVRGRVQGVGFRWWTRSQARRLHLVGWVRNCPDGSVEVQAGGAPEQIAEFRQLLRNGPAGAQVVSVEEFSSATDLGESFEIAR